MLPYRTDVATTPVVQYPPGQPPAMPNVVANPLVAPYLAEIASMAVNELGLKAYVNATRLFAYNALSDNNWRNPRFDKLVEFICDVIVSNISAGKISSAQQGMQDTVSQCVTMITSAFIFEFPDLKLNLPPAILDAAIQNVQVLNDLQTKINTNKGMNMYPQQPMQPMQPQPQNAYGQAVPLQPTVFYDQYGRQCTYDPQGRAVLIQAQPMGQPLVPQQGYPQQMPMGYPQQMPMQQLANQAAGRWAQNQPGGQSFGTPTAFAANPQPVQQSPAYDRYNRTTPQLVQQPEQPAPEPVKELTGDDWRPSEEQYYRIAYDPTRYRAIYRRSPSGNVIEEIEKIMDREKHRTVLGGVNLPPQIEELVVEEAVKAIEKRASYKPVPLETKEGLLMTNFLDEVINDGNVSRLEADHDCYRVIAQVCQPVVQREDVQELLQSFSQCKDLTTLCHRVKAVGLALDNWQSMDDKLDYLLRIDNFLTDVVNSFLSNELSLDKLSIDSFCEDYLELRKYLGKTYGDRHALALQAFDKEAMAGLFQPINTDMKDTLESNVMCDTNEEVFVSFIPHIVTITYVPLRSRELTVMRGNARMLQADSQPVLYNIAESLFVQKTGVLESIEATYHYVVSSDGVRYKLHKGRLSQTHAAACYLVSKA